MITRRGVFGSLTAGALPSKQAVAERPDVWVGVRVCPKPDGTWDYDDTHPQGVYASLADCDAEFKRVSPASGWLREGERVRFSRQQFCADGYYLGAAFGDSVEYALDGNRWRRTLTTWRYCDGGWVSARRVRHIAS